MLAMSQVPVHDPVNQYTTAPGDGQLVKFIVTINSTADIATIGPGWMWDGEAKNGQGAFVSVYPGGTVTPPSSIPSTDVAPG
jgi:hypothetical protein